MRPCRSCFKDVSPGGFPARTLSAKGDSVLCTPCVHERDRRYRQKVAPDVRKAYNAKYVLQSPEKRRESRRKWMFGLSDAALQEMLVAQGNKCALCRDDLPGELFVDHDHSCCPDRGKKTCGKCVRGILCRKCNQGLGMLNDDPELLIAAAMYVVKLRDTLPALNAM